MADEMDDLPEGQDVGGETPPEDVFMAPSVHRAELLDGRSYTHCSAVPPALKADMGIECVLGVDEAGRGPVLGPMVYAVYYLPLMMHKSLLADTHRFDDSKVLTPAVRSELMARICDPETDVYRNCGWAVRSMSARDISAAQLRPYGVYNLNAQAQDATVDLIQGVLDLGVNVREVYIDTIGPPATYQKKLERIFPSLQITVAKKADSIYPCVSAASVCAKVTRDASLDVLYTSYAGSDFDGVVAWGSGYPSDARCTGWMRNHMNPVFGWGSECRFSWGTAKEMLEADSAPCKADWPEPDDATDNLKLSNFFHSDDGAKEDELTTWFGARVGEEVF